MVRGFLKPDHELVLKKHDQTTQGKKEAEQYYLSNQSSFLNPINQELEQAVEELNVTDLKEDYELKQQ